MTVRSGWNDFTERRPEAPLTKGERLVHDLAVCYANKNDSPTAAAGYMPAHRALLDYIAELERERDMYKIEAIELIVRAGIRPLHPNDPPEVHERLAKRPQKNDSLKRAFAALDNFEKHHGSKP